LEGVSTTARAIPKEDSVMARILQVKSGKNNISAGHLLLASTEKVIVSDREYARMPSTFLTNLDDLGPGVLYSPVVLLNTITEDEQVVATFTPGFRGQVLSVFAIVTTAVTTGSKDATLGVYLDRDGGTAEVQTISATGATAGNQTLSLAGQVTGNIAWNAAASAVKTALEALSNVAVGDISVSGGPLNTTPIAITFGGAWAGQDVPLMVIGGTPFITTPMTISTTTPGTANSPAPAVVIGGRLALTSANATPVNKVVAATRVPANPRLGPTQFGKNSVLYVRTTDVPAAAFSEGAVIFGIEVGPSLKTGPVQY
jgi:hypothetical protein